MSHYRLQPRLLSSPLTMCYVSRQHIRRKFRQDVGGRVGSSVVERSVFRTSVPGSIPGPPHFCETSQFWVDDGLKEAAAHRKALGRVSEENGDVSL